MGTLTDTTFPGTGSNANKGVLYTLLISKTGASPSDVVQYNC